MNKQEINIDIELTHQITIEDTDGTPDVYEVTANIEININDDEWDQIFLTVNTIHNIKQEPIDETLPYLLDEALILAQARVKRRLNKPFQLVKKLVKPAIKQFASFKAGVETNYTEVKPNASANSFIYKIGE